MQCFEPVVNPDQLAGEHKPLPMKLIYAGGGALLFIILLVIVLSLRTMPPDKVALEWLETCASSSGRRAMRYTTEQFENSSGLGRSMSVEKAEEYAAERSDVGLTFSASAPKYNKRKRPTKAVVPVTFHYGGMGQVKEIDLTKVGREWKVDGVR